MSKKYVESSFSRFIKFKLNEIKKSTKNNEDPIDDDDQNEEDGIDDDEVQDESDKKLDLKSNKKKLTPGEEGYRAQLIEEFNKIIGDYDRIYGF